ncbi:unnamed protein product [Adineta steineri]|uniref:Uncharacterized protein n=1 Tax=Adineta steineri TaxID=433720 RepID=A0A813ZE22_9BILA|nr:unnamed protein product [Adineta steineri]CAF0934748.1 unnamed protein product [Adineta steineri]CAF3824414.1 unnamed protein product [Adineta steineri]CAF4122517.1 unnamed protein product [Adineta steineri]
MKLYCFRHHGFKSSSASDLTSSEGSAASGGSAVESRSLQHELVPTTQSNNVQNDNTATAAMSDYGVTY